jgi:hypothetical protein
VRFVGRGAYKGSLAARYRIFGELLSLPQEARRILRAIDSAAPNIAECFDRGARLYRLAAVIGRQFPSAGMAYRIAAVEAISKADPCYNGFSDFMRKNVRSVSDPDHVLKQLYGSVRSAHFHAGEFPLGEYTGRNPIQMMMTSDYVEQSQLSVTGDEITREAIVNWVLK